MNLQDEINAAVAGATIRIPDGERCIGNFVIDKPLTILGGPGSAIVAARAHDQTDWANPPIEIKPLTRGTVVLRRLSITVAGDVKNFWDLIRYGGADNASGQTSIDKAPQGLWIDECDIFGRVDAGSQRGISANGSNFKITKSKVREIHGKGFDTQAICSWNGPGPFVIEDCYLEAAGENVMFGGSPPVIPGLIHTGITMLRSHCFKPLSWRGVWTVKNLFELKNARNVIVDGCIFDGNWTDAQAGRAIQFTPRPSDSGSSALVEDVRFTNNIIRNTGSGVNVLGADEPPAPTETRLKRLRIANCLFEIDGRKFGSDGVFLVVTNRSEDVIVENCTILHTGNIIIADYAPNIRFTYRNNISRHNNYGIFGSGSGIGNPSIVQYFPGSSISGNVMAREVDGPSSAESMYPIGNHFPATLNDVGFVDLAGGNLRLATSSPFKGKGTNGKDPGCDLDALNAAQGGVTSPTPLPVPEPIPTPTPTPTPSPVPTPEPSTGTPSPDGFKGAKIVDSQGATWTLSAEPEFRTLRNDETAGGGQGKEYKYLNRTVFVLGMDGSWYRWGDSARSWAWFGKDEPGVTTPQPEPQPEPIPIPDPIPDPPKPPTADPVPATPRTVRWSTSLNDQMTLILTQGREMYRPSGRTVPRPANQPKGNYVEFVKF